MNHRTAESTDRSGGAESVSTLLDLQPFCEELGDYRRHLQAPFSDENFTYATNGHILVRVPRRPDVAVSTHKSLGQVQHHFATVRGDNFKPVANLKLQPDVAASSEGCVACSGTGKEHPDCDHCECTCLDCDGTGIYVKKPEQSATLYGASYQTKYLRLLAKLPNARLAENKSGEPTPFSFDGGAGILTPLRNPYRDNVDAITGAGVTDR